MCWVILDKAEKNVLNFKFSQITLNHLRYEMTFIDKSIAHSQVHSTAPFIHWGPVVKYCSVWPDWAIFEFSLQQILLQK